MNIETGVVRQPLRVDDDLVLIGIADSGVTVASGAELVVTGIVSRGLTIEAGGRAVVTGIVSDGLANAGDVEIHGIVQGGLRSADGASTVVMPGAIIDGVKH
jgi:hypothetical protein